jgi:hypothetical protein
MRKHCGVRSTEEIEEDPAGRLVIPASAIPVDDDMVRALRYSDQRWLSCSA